MKYSATQIYNIRV